MYLLNQVHALIQEHFQLRGFFFLIDKMKMPLINSKGAKKKAAQDVYRKYTKGAKTTFTKIAEKTKNTKKNSPAPKTNP